MSHRRVILESPYAGEVNANVIYARRALRDSLMRGEAPIASHLLYTQRGVLDDLVPEERQHGIDAGLAWGGQAEMTVCYVDRGISRGMEYGIEKARAEGRLIEYRKIGENPPELATDRQLLSDAVDLVIWMSGSADFSREGQAGEGWTKNGLPFLKRALAHLKLRQPDEPNLVEARAEKAPDPFDDGVVGG